MVLPFFNGFLDSVQAVRKRQSLTDLLFNQDAQSSPDAGKGRAHRKPKAVPVPIDGTALFYYLYMKKVDWSVGGDGPAFVALIRNFFKSLEACNIIPVVFSPPLHSPLLSSSTELKKGKRSVKLIARLANAIEENPTKYIADTSRGEYHPLAYYTFIETMRALNVQLRVTDGLVVPYICSYAKAKGVPIIAYDSIYSACDIQYYINSDSLFFKSGEVIADIVDNAHMLSTIGVTLKQFQLVFRLLPSDLYIGTLLMPFRDGLMAQAPTQSQSQPEPTAESPDGTKARLPQKSIMKLQTIVDFVRSSDGASDNAASDDYDGLFRGIVRQSIEEYNKDSEKYKGIEVGDSFYFPMLHAADTLKDFIELGETELVRILHSSAHVFETKDYRNTVSLTAPEGTYRYSNKYPEWFEKLLRQGLVPPFVIPAINNSLVTLKCSLEAVSGSILGRTSACLLGRMLRLALYSILGLLKIEEQLRMGADWVSEVLDVPPFEAVVAQCNLSQYFGSSPPADVSYMDIVPNLKAPERQRIVLLLLLDGNAELLDALVDNFSHLDDECNERSDGNAKTKTKTEPGAGTGTDGAVEAASEMTESGSAPYSATANWQTDVFYLACLMHAFTRLSELEEPAADAEAADEKAPVSAECLAALLTETYLPTDQQLITASSKTKICHKDIHMLTFVSAIQFVQEAALAINAVFGRPLDVSVESLHKGLAYAIAYHEELIEKNSQLHKFNNMLADPSTPCAKSDTFTSVIEARQTGNYRALSKQEKYMYTHILGYEKLRRSLVLLKQKVMPSLSPRSSPVRAITQLTDGSYATECHAMDGDKNCIETRFTTVYVKQQKKKTTYVDNRSSAFAEIGKLRKPGNA